MVSFPWRIENGSCNSIPSLTSLNNLWSHLARGKSRLGVSGRRATGKVRYTCRLDGFTTELADKFARVAGVSPRKEGCRSAIIILLLHVSIRFWDSILSLSLYIAPYMVASQEQIDDPLFIGVVDLFVLPDSGVVCLEAVAEVIP